MSNVSRTSKFAKTATALLVVFSMSPVGAEAAEDAVASYERAYLSPVETVCAARKPAKSIVRTAEFRYPKIGDPAAADTLRSMVRSVGGDSSGMENVLAGPLDAADSAEAVLGPSARLVSAASEAYKERVNAVFACAQIGFKIRIHDRIIASVRGEDAASGNLVRRIEDQTRMLRQEANKRGCADLSSTQSKDNVYLKKDVLDNAFYQYCDYRHYLSYLKTNGASRLAEFREAGKTLAPEGAPAAAAPLSSEEAVAGIVEASSRIDREIAHTKEVFPNALLAYQEFERTYGPHVALLILTEDYRLLRDSLKQVMNPLGQVIYKASNAQSPYSR